MICSSSVGGHAGSIHTPGLDLSKTPTAEMERVLYEPSTVPVSQVSASSAKVLDYSGAVLERACKEAGVG